MGKCLADKGIFIHYFSPLRLMELRLMDEWVLHWAGKWSLLSCSYFGEQYTKTVKEFLGVCLDSTIFISKKGFSVAYFKKVDVTRFGKALATQIIADEKKVGVWCTALKKETDNVISAIEACKGRDISFEMYNKVWEALQSYSAPHIGVKKVVDYLPPELLEKHLPQLSEARVYAEKVYTESEVFMLEIADKISNRSGIKRELILCMAKDEFTEYLKEEVFPESEVLEERFARGGLVFEKGIYKMFSGDAVCEYEDIVNKGVGGSELSGSIAFPGKVVGRCKIILDPFAENDFEKGDILVTGMTRPEFLPLMEKASAIVTDAGGVLCHAAITAREMKIPCIVGTEKATTFFENSENIEVDAGRGIVRKVRKG